MTVRHVSSVVDTPSVLAVFHTLKRLLDIDSLLCAGLKVRNAALRLAECLCPLRTDHPLAVLHIDFVSEHHEGEALWVHRTGLDQELVPP